MSAFDSALKRGAAGESVVAAYFQERGYIIQPAYEKLELDFKGPRAFGPDRPYVAPDLFALIVKAGEPHAMYIEVKTKTHFTYYGKKRQFETGIDVRLYEHYLALSSAVALPVYLFFLHTTNNAWPLDVEKYQAPPYVAGGLFYGRIDELDRIKRRGEMMQRGAVRHMMYWARSDLTHVASLQTLSDIAARWDLPWPPK